MTNVLLLCLLNGWLNRIIHLNGFLNLFSWGNDDEALLTVDLVALVAKKDILVGLDKGATFLVEAFWVCTLKFVWVYHGERVTFGTMSPLDSLFFWGLAIYRWLQRRLLCIIPRGWLLIIPFECRGHWSILSNPKNSMLCLIFWKHLNTVLNFNLALLRGRIWHLNQTLGSDGL